MTEITPELKALADAAIGHVRALLEHEGAYAGYSHASIEAQKFLDDITTQAKECRPPAGAKDGSLWWLTNPTEQIVGEWVNGGWRLPGTEIIALEAGEDGWTCHSECRFGETGVSVTCEEIDQFLKSRGVELLNTTLFHLTEFIEQVRAPKLEISDEEILDVAGQHTDWPTGAPSGGLLASQLTQIVRAVIAKVGGEK